METAQSDPSRCYNSCTSAAKTDDPALTWEATDEGCSEGKIWYALPQLTQQLHCMLLRWSVHAEEDHVANMLQWNINVFAHLQHVQKLH